MNSPLISLLSSSLLVWFSVASAATNQAASTQATASKPVTAPVTAQQQAAVNAQAKVFGQTCREAYNYRAVKVSGLAAGMMGKILHDESLKELKKQGGAVLRDEWNAATKSFRLLSRKGEKELFLGFVPDAGAYAVVSCRTK